jgi:hypothetical protein
VLAAHEREKKKEYLEARCLEQERRNKYFYTSKVIINYSSTINFRVSAWVGCPRAGCAADGRRPGLRRAGCRVCELWDGTCNCCRGRY